MKDLFNFDLSFPSPLFVLIVCTKAIKYVWIELNVSSSPVQTILASVKAAIGTRVKFHNAGRALPLDY